MMEGGIYSEMETRRGYFEGEEAWKVEGSPVRTLDLGRGKYLVTKGLEKESARVGLKGWFWGKDGEGCWKGAPAGVEVRRKAQGISLAGLEGLKLT